MLKKSLALLGFAASLLFAGEMQVGAYYPYWLQYSQFTPEDVRYEFLTDIYYGYYVPSEDGSSLANADESDEPNFEKLAKLSKEKKVNLVLCIGGAGNEESMKAVASSDDAMSAFVSTVKEFSSKYNLSGVELDWTPAEDGDYAALGKMVSALAGEGVSVAVSVTGTTEAAALYPADAMKKASAVMVMLTDQMSEENEEVVPNSNFTYAQEVLKAYAAAGISSSKIVPVVPMYGKSFYKASGLGTKHEGVGSGNEGAYSYKDLMAAFDAPDYKVTFDEATQSEVAVSASETIVFNGIPSMKSISTFVKENGFGGVAVYDISGDHKEPVVSLLVTIGQVLRPDVQYKTKKKK